MQLAFLCKACKKTKIKDVPFPKLATEIGFEHEDGCPFIEAIDQKQSAAWIERFGFPLEIGVKK